MEVGRYYQRNQQKLAAISSKDWKEALAKCIRHIELKLKNKTLYGAHAGSRLGAEAVDHYVSLAYEKIISGDWELKDGIDLAEQMIRIIGSYISKAVKHSKTNKAAALNVQYVPIEDEFYNKRTNLESLVDSIEKDPYGIDENTSNKDSQMKKFQESQAEMGTNMAVVMFMVDAMQYFEGKPKSKVKESAFEIASLGTQGIKPDGQYVLRTVPNKDFSGYHLLAYYYVSWAIAVPEMLKELRLPYDDEYKMALTLHKPKK